MRFPFIPLFLLALPFLEIAGFVIVGGEIGVLATLALVVAGGLVGALLLRAQGFGLLSRVRSEVDAGRDPGQELANGVMMLAAGLLLLLPGFVTDGLGLLLLLPPVRRMAWRFLKSRVVVSTAGFAGFSRTRPGGRGEGGRTIDLDADEYRNDPQPESPWRRIDRD
ncbi:FxsA family protein [Mesorhizobium marinum]|uniref:FxsA family protein n=1 Tax=Mesorhizobium marinum TaxID=3228790 RepID=UPI003466E1F9